MITFHLCIFVFTKQNVFKLNILAYKIHKLNTSAFNRQVKMVTSQHPSYFSLLLTYYYYVNKQNDRDHFFKDNAVLMYGILSEIIVTRLNFLDLSLRTTNELTNAYRKYNTKTNVVMYLKQVTWLEV